MPASKRKRKGRRPDYIVRASTGGKGRWWADVPWLWLGAAALIGFPMLRDASSDRMLRNRYADEASCRCDYAERCGADMTQPANSRQWVGPWYAGSAGDRAADDAGAGACRSGGGHGGVGGYAYRQEGYREPVSIERGYRGGFGGSGHVRAGS
ncbi:MAG: hypothetical protein EOP93_10985 [Lysobacteraceae bacterium]|nr:MAG: hypothetical protein EOP93_10985 [Xanthomonadaceae bacterium]